MESKDLQPDARRPDALGHDRKPWDEAQADLRTRIVQHYAWVAEWDREYAEWSYRRTREQMPWLNL